MMAGRGAVPPDSPTSPKTPRREGEAWGGGVVRALRKPSPLPALRRRKRKPAPCLRCAPMYPMSPRAAGEGSLGLCAGGGLAGGGDGGGRRGGWAGVRTRPPPHASPSLPPTAPQTEGGARNAPRPAIMLRFHPRFLTILIPIPANMDNVLDYVYLRASLGVFFPFKAARIFPCSIQDIQNKAVRSWALLSPCTVRGRISSYPHLSLPALCVGLQCRQNTGSPYPMSI